MKVEWNNINTFVLGTVIGLVGKVERRQDRHGLKREW